MSKYHKAAESCPVCGGMMGETCEVCGNGNAGGNGNKERRTMRLILQPETKEDVTDGLMALVKAMERDAKAVPEKVKITVGPPADFNFGVEFRIEWE